MRQAKSGGTEMEQRRINRIRTQQRKQEREIKQQPFVIAQQRWQTQIEAGRVQTWGDW